MGFVSVVLVVFDFDVRVLVLYGGLFVIDVILSLLFA